MVALSAVAGVLVRSTIAIGSGHMAYADNGDGTKVFNNKGVNVQTHTNQNQGCETAGNASGIGLDFRFGSNSCTASSTDNTNQSAGDLKK
ncbi:MAG: hypothetical protein WA667_14645 [Candidatus Nitrosopolaris sp.]